MTFLAKTCVVVPASPTDVLTWTAKLVGKEVRDLGLAQVFDRARCGAVLEMELNA